MSFCEINGPGGKRIVPAKDVEYYLTRGHVKLRDVEPEEETTTAPSEEETTTEVVVDADSNGDEDEV